MEIKINVSEGAEIMNPKLVSIVMGSDSDLPVMQESALALDKFGIGYDIFIASAHRHPEKTASLARNAAGDGKKVIIAGAGGAAHLPGVLASMTTLPVIGIPIRGRALEGMDSLLSIVQMPRGIPVATVAVDGAFNAGLLAVQIIAIADPVLQEKLNGYRHDLSKDVEQKDRYLQEGGFRKYLKEKLPPRRT